ncbi:MAG TPA: hypothetical protein VGV59_15270 [Pyrinomonadaceae bacterium]|nr:hypothetical protein [Pyrinomonadaceae bacterium]
MASLVGRVIDFAGEAEIKGEGGLTQKVGFLGAYETGGVISFSLSFHEKLFTFFGVVTPTAAPRMAGVIISASLTGVGGGEDASEDEGSWSSQAPPREDDSDRP